jgi:very-short-patch-repair endonuclease
VALSAASTAGSGGEHESFLEKSVADSLRTKGWVVDAQVGCSGYRIDLAVKNPDRAGEYLCGIECDGAAYHSARTARDRDRLREQVLRRLGWTIHRVWSSDWWYEPEKVLSTLDARLSELRDAAQARGTDPLSLGNTNPLEPPADTQAEPPRIRAKEGAPPIATHVAEAAATFSPTPEAAPGHAPAPSVSVPADPLPGQATYRAWSGGGSQGYPSGLYEARQTLVIARYLREVLSQEAPVAVTLAARRVARLWGIEKVTEKARDRMVDVIRTAVPEARVAGEFLWGRDQQAARYTGFRVPGDDSTSQREAEEIPPEEAANAAEALLPRLVSLPRRDLTREMAKLFGFQRLGRRVEGRMEEGVTLLASRGGCVVTGDVVSLPRK